jgi:hypothetical protein
MTCSQLSRTRGADGRGDDVGHRVRVAHRAELAQPRAVAEAGQHRGRDLQGEARLADAADTGQRDGSRLPQRLGDLRHLAFTSDEGRELLGQVGRVRAQRAQRGELLGQLLVCDLEETFGVREVAQAVLAEVGEADAVDRGVAHEPQRRERAQDLTAVRHRHESRGAVRRRPVVVAVAQLGLARVDAHTDPQREPVGPRLARERELRVDRRRDRVVRRGEHGVHTVAGRLHDETVVELDRGPEDLVVAGECGRHRRGLFLPEAGRALDIGEQERDRPRRQLGHYTP